MSTWDLEEDGSFSIDPSLTGERQEDDVQLMELVRETLYELASFSLFAASLSMPLEEEQKLAQEVYRRLHALDF